MDQINEEQVSALCLPPEKAQALRIELKKRNLLDKSRRLKKIDEKTVAIPVKCGASDLKSLLDVWPDVRISDCALPPSKQSLIQTPFAKMSKAVSNLLDENNLPKSLIQEIPHKWERHGDLIIIPVDAFISPQWLDLEGQELWYSVANSLTCSRIARHSPVADNGYRSSQVVLLLGEDGRVIHCDNGIQYCYDVTKCMFSAGNITEKLRVANFNCNGQVIVDLFAGIGYFTLPYLVHAKARHVHACEWNPDASKYLQENLHLNGVKDKCTLHFGDNRELDLENVADRINLGLIPTSELSWPTAVKVLKTGGGFMHIHGNVIEAYPDKSGEVSESHNLKVDVSPSLPNSFHGANEVGDHGIPDIDSVVEIPSKDKCPSSSSTTCEFHLPSEWNKSPGMHINEQNISPHFVPWTSQVSKQIHGLLGKIKGGQWAVMAHHVEKVKSYAPHIDHVVLDLECQLVVGT